MHQTPLSATPLGDISIKAHGRDALATELSLRIADGREQEVIAYMRDCNRYALLQLQMVESACAVWRRSAAMWLTFARLTVPRGVIFPEPYDSPPQRDAAFSQEMRTMAEKLIAGAVAGTGAPSPREAMGFVAESLIKRLPYPGMPQEAVRELFDWNSALREASGGADRDDANLAQLARFVSDTDELIALAGKGEDHFLAAIWAYEDRSGQLSGPERWLPWHDFFRRNPDYIDWQHYAIKDPALIAWRWPQAMPEVRRKLAHTLLAAVRETAGSSAHADQAVYLATIDRLMDHDESAFAALLEKHAKLFGGPVADLIREKHAEGALRSLFD